jgi:hypothetical protein
LHGEQNKFGSLELAHDGARGAGAGKRTALLKVDTGEDAILHDESPTHGANATEAARVHVEAERLGEGSVAVGQEGNLAFSQELLRERAVDERIVDREARDCIDSLGREVFRGGDKLGRLAVRAGRGERAGQREENDLLAGEDVLERERRPTS